MKEEIRKKFEKIVVNVGVGKLRNLNNFEDKILPEVMKELALITGQKPQIRPAKKSIAGFKIRTNDIVGLKVTLRDKRMADFFIRLINIVLPRVKDFQGIDVKNIDKNGNLNIGLKEQLVFPEISADQSKVNFGLQVTIVIKPEFKKDSLKVYKQLGVPFKVK